MVSNEHLEKVVDEQINDAESLFRRLVVLVREVEDYHKEATICLRDAKTILSQIKERV